MLKESFMKIVALIVLAAGMALGQSPATESVEHKVARTELEQVDAAYKLALEKVGPLHDTTIHRQRVIVMLEKVVSHVDECKELYTKTIDMKVSDMTQRQTDNIKACKALASYPPATSLEKWDVHDIDNPRWQVTDLQ